jgi:hypothetical protein
VGFQAEGLAGGVLLGVKGQGGIGLFDWQTGGLVRRIEVDPKEVIYAITSRGLSTDLARYIGLRAENSSRWRAKILSTSYASHAKTTLPLFNLARSRMMV